MRAVSISAVGRGAVAGTASGCLAQPAMTQAAAITIACTMRFMLNPSALGSEAALSHIGDVELDLHRTMHVPVDGKCLPGHGSCGIRCQEHCERRDLAGLGETLQRLVAQRVVVLVVER